MACNEYSKKVHDDLNTNPNTEIIACTRSCTCLNDEMRKMIIYIFCKIKEYATHYFIAT